MEIWDEFALEINLGKNQNLSGKKKFNFFTGKFLKVWKWGKIWRCDLSILDEVSALGLRRWNSWYILGKSEENAKEKRNFGDWHWIS